MSMERRGNGLEKATFAGGCFWCLEAFFEGIEGVIDVISGYTGGHMENPNYEQVCSGMTGHREAIRIIYDPSLISYERLLELFWTQIDPFDDGGQFADRGSQYGTAIFYHNESQKKAAEESRQRLESELKKRIVTQILPSENFFDAEEYHQDYYRTCPLQYQAYRKGSGRKRRFEEIWGKE